MSSGSISVHSLIDKFSGEKKTKGGSAGEREREQGGGLVRSASVGATAGLPGTPGSMGTSGSFPERQTRGATSELGGRANRTRASVELSSSYASVPDRNDPSRSTATTSENAPTPAGFSGNNPYTPAPGAVDISSTGLLTLLGPSVTSFPFSEQAYIESIKLRSEQEKTKQDFYRLEIANKNLAILQNALRSQIPVNLIPLMCVGNLPPELEHKQQQLQQSQIPQSQQLQQSSLQQSSLQPQQLQPQSQQPQQQSQQMLQPPTPPQQHSRSSSNRSSLTQPDSLSASVIPPMNYRFGGGSSAPGPGSRRPLSPAKIRAVAVANLATPTTPYRNMSSSRRPLRSHQRHYSMPVESHARGVNLNLAETQTKSKGTSVSLATSGQHNPMGSTSTLQVKPSPAQPLHRQNKSSQPPSQESMTSFQHIIQFHHWKPDGTQGPAIGGGNPFRAPSAQQSQLPSHKRHKSDSMSIDLNSDTLVASGDVVSPHNNMKPMVVNSKMIIHEDDDDDEDDDARDMTMNTSTISDNTNSPNTTKIVPSDDPERTPLEGGHIRTSSNVGRYPHDILAPY